MSDYPEEVDMNHQREVVHDFIDEYPQYDGIPRRFFQNLIQEAYLPVAPSNWGRTGPVDSSVAVAAQCPILVTPDVAERLQDDEIAVVQINVSLLPDTVKQKINLFDGVIQVFELIGDAPFQVIYTPEAQVSELSCLFRPTHGNSTFSETFQLTMRATMALDHPAVVALANEAEKYESEDEDCVQFFIEYLMDRSMLDHCSYFGGFCLTHDDSDPAPVRCAECGSECKFWLHLDAYEKLNTLWKPHLIEQTSLNCFSCPHCHTQIVIPDVR